MRKLIDLAKGQLETAGYEYAEMEMGRQCYLIFDNSSVIGFVLFFKDAKELIGNWEAVSGEIFKTSQLSLRRAGAKSWNLYLILLAEVSGNYGDTISLGTIEENLVGARKIARAGISDEEEMHEAMLSLVDIQTAPRLPVVNMREEIKLRTSELPLQLVDAFLGDTSESTLSQIFEMDS